MKVEFHGEATEEHERYECAADDEADVTLASDTLDKREQHSLSVRVGIGPIGFACTKLRSLLT